MLIPTILLTQICTIKPFLYKTPKGPIYDTVYSCKCRFEEHRKKYTNPNGIEYISSGRLFIMPTTDNKELINDTVITVDGINYTQSEKFIHRCFTDSHVELILI